jgi:probable F420-dependent oxidoreductase
MTCPIGIGYQINGSSASDPIGAAKRAEALGFDVVLVSDHVGPGPSPLVTLGAIAQATERIRIGTFVLNNDMRNPVKLAWQATTLDRLSGGRFELGRGAGPTPVEYLATGIVRRSARERKQQLQESVEVIRRLLDGETVTFEGAHINVRDAAVDRSTQGRLPILVGGNGAELLEHAGRHADIVGLQGLGRTYPDGHQHEAKWGREHLEEQLRQVRGGTSETAREAEINAMVQAVRVTEDRPSALRAVCEWIGDLPLDHAASTPYLLVGSVEEIVGQLRRHREELGISYFVVRELESFAPILDALGDQR